MKFVRYTLIHQSHQDFWDKKGEDKEGKKKKRGQGTLKMVISAEQFCQPEPTEKRTQTLRHSGQTQALALEALERHVLIAFGAKSQFLVVDHDALWVYSVPKYNMLHVSPKLVTLYFWFLTKIALPCN